MFCLFHARQEMIHRRSFVFFMSRQLRRIQMSINQRNLHLKAVKLPSITMKHRRCSTADLWSYCTPWHVDTLRSTQTITSCFFRMRFLWKADLYSCGEQHLGFPSSNGTARGPETPFIHLQRLRSSCMTPHACGLACKTQAAGAFWTSVFPVTPEVLSRKQRVAALGNNFKKGLPSSFGNKAATQLTEQEWGGTRRCTPRAGATINTHRSERWRGKVHRSEMCAKLQKLCLCRDFFFYTFNVWTI